MAVDITETVVETDAEFAAQREMLLKNGWRCKKLDAPFECGGEQVRELWYHPIHSRGFSLRQAMRKVLASGEDNCPHPQPKGSNGVSSG